MSLLLKAHSGIELLSGHDFLSQEVGDLQVLSKGLDEKTILDVVRSYRNESLHKYLDACAVPSFALVLIDRMAGVICVANDKFGSNELYYTLHNSIFYITDDLPRFFEESALKPSINTRAAYELLSFHSVKPPRTIYENVFAVPMAQTLVYNLSAKSYRSEQYWRPHDRLVRKASAYGSLVETVREVFDDALQREAGQNPGVALSGGIDSGGILGALTQKLGRPIPSVTIGGWGAKTPDLASSRQTAQENRSENVEIYPNLHDVARLPILSERLNQPLLADILLPNALLFEKAREKGIQKLAFGFGAEMLLGNLKMSRALYALGPFERYAPKWLLKVAYPILGLVRSLSQNQLEFLLAASLPERFLHARGALFTRERAYFKHLPEDFLAMVTEEVESEARIGEVGVLDSIVLMYLFSWVNYLQRRDMGMLARKFGMGVIIPFDTPQVAEVMFTIPNKFRRLNGWNKQLVRDTLRPYVSARLYAGVVRSLIVPYSVLFASCRQPLMQYLKTSSLITELIDMDKYERDYDVLPEPGLSLMRLVGLAVWYDVTWDKQNIANFERAIHEARLIVTKK